jgi:pimeloyl-ACP methyl ester carboxylesterase
VRTSLPSLLPLALVGCLVLGAASGVETGQRTSRASVAREARPTVVSGFAPIGDVKIYYEARGTGDPILFIHGGGGSIQRSWPREYIDDLSRNFMVIMADSRGQGRSTDGAGPITFNRLAFDSVRLLDHLGLARAHLVGHSSGAIAGLHLLVDFPDRVKTATLLAGAYHVDNYRPEAFAEMKAELEAVIRGERSESRLTAIPPPVLRKFHTSWLTGPYFTLRVLENISTPTLIVAAGRDSFFPPSVAEDMHAHIKDSELLVFPEATHRVQVTNVKELVPAIRDFIVRRGER